MYTLRKRKERGRGFKNWSNQKYHRVNSLHASFINMQIFHLTSRVVNNIKGSALSISISVVTSKQDGGTLTKLGYHKKTRISERYATRERLDRIAQ